MKKRPEMGCGFGLVVSAVASNTTGSQFESSHWIFLNEHIDC